MRVGVGSKKCQHFEEKKPPWGKKGSKKLRKLCGCPLSYCFSPGSSNLPTHCLRIRTIMWVPSSLKLFLTSSLMWLPPPSSLTTHLIVYVYEQLWRCPPPSSYLHPYSFSPSLFGMEGSLRSALWHMDRHLLQVNFTS